VKRDETNSVRGGYRSFRREEEEEDGTATVVVEFGDSSRHPGLVAAATGKLCTRYEAKNKSNGECLTEFVMMNL